MVRSAIVMLIFLNSIGALQLFIEPEILSYQGGSITNTWTPVVDIYNTSIANAQYNLGAAMAVVLALAIIAVSVGSMAFRRHRGELA
jgi:multiple sugar transport system permease protein